MNTVYIKEIDVFDENGTHLATFKRFDEESFEVKAEGILTPTELRELADFTEALERSGGEIVKLGAEMQKLPKYF